MKPIHIEGWAEFLRKWLTDPPKARQETPKLTTFFESQLDANEDLKEILTEFQQSIEEYARQPARAKLHSRIVTDVAPLPKRRWDRFYRAMVDRLKPIQDAVEVLSKKGAPVTTEKDSYRLARLLAGWTAKANEYLTVGTFDAITLKTTGKSLQEILAPFADNLDLLRDYLVARRALEKRRQGIRTGIGVDEAIGTLRDLHSNHKDQMPALRTAANQIYKFNDQLLAYLVRLHYISQEQFDEIRKMNRNYVPFYRLFEEELIAGGGGRKLVDLWQPVKSMKGSERAILDPLESTIRNAYTFINLAERNRVALELVKQARAVAGSAVVIEEVSPPVKPTTFELSEIKKKLGEAGADLKNADLELIATVFRPAVHPIKHERIVTVWENGKKRMIQIGPKELYEALEAIDGQQMGDLLRILSTPSRVLRLGATGLSPDFPLRNIWRDLGTAMMQFNQGLYTPVDALKGVFHVLKRDDLYHEWRRAGGEHAALMAMDRTTLQKHLKDLTSSRLKNVVRHPVEALRAFSDAMEAANRLGAYTKARKKGLTALEAAFESREVTLDFARMGSYGKVLNGIIAFWNAQVQGTDKFVRVHKEDLRGSMVKGFLGITIPSLSLLALNWDDERYWELPEWERSFFWHVPTLGLAEEPFFRIPKPFLWGAVYGTTFEHVARWIFKRNPASAKEYVDSIAGMALPGFIPTFMAPLIEIWANRSFFFDRQLVPQYLQRVSEEHQATERTSEWSRETAKGLAWLAEKTGVEAFRVSPISLDHALYGYTAGLGRAVSSVVDIPIRKMTGPQRGPKGHWPTSRSFADS